MVKLIDNNDERNALFFGLYGSLWSNSTAGRNNKIACDFKIQEKMQQKNDTIRDFTKSVWKISERRQLHSFILLVFKQN